MTVCQPLNWHPLKRPRIRHPAHGQRARVLAAPHNAIYPLPKARWANPPPWGSSPTNFYPWGISTLSSTGLKWYTGGGLANKTLLRGSPLSIGSVAIFIIIIYMGGSLNYLGAGINMSTLVIYFFGSLTALNKIIYTLRGKEDP